MTQNNTLTRTILHLVASAATLVVAGVGVSTAASGAIFTDVDSSTVDVTSGWVDVEVGGASVLALSNLKPGDVLFRAVNVANTGSLGFSYTLTASRPNNSGAPLADALQAEGWVTPTYEACSAAGYQAGTRVVSSTSFGGFVAAGRDLPAGTAETLCIRISLPPSTPNGIAGKSSTVTLTVDSEQLP